MMNGFKLFLEATAVSDTVKQIFSAVTDDYNDPANVDRLQAGLMALRDILSSAGNHEKSEMIETIYPATLVYAPPPNSEDEKVKEKLSANLIMSSRQEISYLVGNCNVGFASFRRTPAFIDDVVSGRSRPYMPIVLDFKKGEFPPLNGEYEHSAKVRVFPRINQNIVNAAINQQRGVLDYIELNKLKFSDLFIGGTFMYPDRIHDKLSFNADNAQIDVPITDEVRRIILDKIRSYDGTNPHFGRNIINNDMEYEYIKPVYSIRLAHYVMEAKGLFDENETED